MHTGNARGQGTIALARTELGQTTESCTDHRATLYFIVVHRPSGNVDASSCVVSTGLRDLGARLKRFDADVLLGLNDASDDSTTLDEHRRLLRAFPSLLVYRRGERDDGALLRGGMHVQHSL